MNIRLPLFLAVSILTGVSTKAFAIFGDLGSENRDVASLQAIKVQEALIDKSGKYPDRERNLKTGYKDLDNEVKAAWAFDLGQFVENQGESVEKVSETYIPYKKRAEFADFWLLRHVKDYKGKMPWDKDAWQHDAILDGTELYWLGVQSAKASSDNFTVGHDAEMGWLKEKKDSAKN